MLLLIFEVGVGVGVGKEGGGDVRWCVVLGDRCFGAGFVGLVDCWFDRGMHVFSVRFGG